ncbi:MAG: ATP-binding cassette domain-containing protein [Candidatus Eisenbacteria bacterium]
MIGASTASRVTLGARGLRHRYAGHRGLDPVEFELAGPGVVAVVGANGSGKSTLLRIVAGLLRPSHGATAFAVDGRDIAPAERRHHVGYAAPELQFYVEFSVSENLHFAAEARGLTRPAQAVDEALARVGLASRAADRVDALSSGMKQRLRLASALLHRPPLLLLDEAGTHLDEEGRQALEGIVAEEARTGLVVLATNEEREWRLAERQVRLSGGGLGHPA